MHHISQRLKQCPLCLQEFPAAAKTDTADYYCESVNSAGPAQRCRAMKMEVRKCPSHFNSKNLLLAELFLAYLTKKVYWFALPCFPVFSSRWPKHRRNCRWCNSGSAACGPTDICHLVCQKERISAWLVFHIIFKSDFYRPHCSDDDQWKVSLLIQAGKGLKSVSVRSTLCWCCFLSSYYSKERKVSGYFYAFKCYLTLLPLV